jgi:hypothetical protein
MNRMLGVIVVAVVVCLGVPAFSADSEGGAMGSMLAGIAVRDLTPEPGIDLWGYSDRKGPAEGTLDPLNARALVLRGGGKTVAVVTMDMGRVPVPDALERIRAKAKSAGVDFVFLAASHTHHGPDIDDGTAAHSRKIEALVGDCIVEAAGKLQPASIGIGRAEFDIAHNRRIVTDDGKCAMLWRNEARQTTNPVDKEATIIKVAGQDGKPLAILVHFACHPVVMGPSNLRYSADYPGEMARVVKERTGAECMFLQGACGNINPYLDKTPIDKGGVEAMREVGRSCATAILDALGSIEPGNPGAAALDYVEKPVEVGTRWDLKNADNVAFLRRAYGDAFDKYVGEIGEDFSVPLSIVLINKEIALVGMPGEPFVQFQRSLKEGSPAAHTLLCGYCNGFCAYIPTIRDAAAGGYGGTVATFVGLGAGEKLVAEAEIELGLFLGKLSPMCKLQDFLVVDAPGQP